jgi:SAM-dependent methyltransferase
MPMDDPILYDRIGVGYATHRRPDPRIASWIATGLGSAQSIINVGAGVGSYEPANRSVVAVEPSLVMVRQRADGAAPAIRASADRLPFRDRSFDAALAVLTIHHWSNWKQGFREMQRVASERVVVLTWDPEHPGFWLVQDYFPEILAIDRRIFPSLTMIEEVVGPVTALPVPVPADCLDGFLGAFWRRPETYLDPMARRSISTFAKLKDLGAGLARLRSDLETGVWEARHGSVLPLEELDMGYRLVVARGGGR